MAFIPINGLEINADFVTSGSFTPVNGLGINANFITGIYRALIISVLGLKQIADSEIGQGKKPIVMINGIIKEREATEGLPIVLINSNIMALTSDSELLI